MFGSKLNRAQKKLEKRFFDAGLVILQGKDVQKYLSSIAKDVAPLKAELSDDEYRDAFKSYWSRCARHYEPFFNRGTDPDELVARLWRWAVTLNSEAIWE